MINGTAVLTKEVGGNGDCLHRSGYVYYTITIAVTLQRGVKTRVEATNLQVRLSPFYLNLQLTINRSYTIEATSKTTNCWC